MIKKLLNQAGICTDELTPEAWALFGKIAYRELIRPLILEDRNRGTSWRQIGVKYRITHRQAINIANKKVYHLSE